MNKIPNYKKLQKISKVLKNYRVIKGHANILDRTVKVAKKTLRCEGDIPNLSFDSIKSKGKVSNIVETIVLQEIENIEELEIKRDIYTNIAEAIEESINLLEEDERQVLTKYYLDNRKLSWKQIADEIGMSEDNARGYLKKKSMLSLYDILYGNNFLEEIKEN